MRTDAEKVREPDLGMRVMMIFLPFSGVSYSLSYEFGPPLGNGAHAGTRSGRQYACVQCAAARRSSDALGAPPSPCLAASVTRYDTCISSPLKGFGVLPASVERTPCFTPPARAE